MRLFLSHFTCFHAGIAICNYQLSQIQRDSFHTIYPIRYFPYGSACNRSRHGLPLIVTAAPHPPCLARRNFPPFLLPVPISGFLPLQYKVIKLLCRTFASFMRGLFCRHPAFCRLTPPTRYTERSPVAVERVVQCDRESHRTTYV